MTSAKTKKREKVLIGMSGGVDSCVAALLLVREGYDVTGATMDLGTPGSQKDIQDAAEAAERIGIKHIVLDLKNEFDLYIKQYFKDEYEAGRTPNPCVMCNRQIKMGSMLDRALELGFDKIATGHYAIVSFNKEKKKYELQKGLSADKDQSYFLYYLTQERLSRLLMPLGILSKEKVKEIAAAQGLTDPHRGESQDICFIPDGNYANYLAKESSEGLEPGDFIDSKGNVLGKHNGLIRYTVGQRKGIGIAAGYPLFVISKDPSINTVVLGPESDLYKNELTVSDLNLIDPDENIEKKEIRVKIRYASKEHTASFNRTDEKSGEVKFKTPVKGIAPGQSAVFYDGTRVIGGGIIS